MWSPPRHDRDIMAFPNRTLARPTSVFDGGGGHGWDLFLGCTLMYNIWQVLRAQAFQPPSPSHGLRTAITWPCGRYMQPPGQHLMHVAEAELSFGFQLSVVRLDWQVHGIHTQPHGSRGFGGWEGFSVSTTGQNSCKSELHGPWQISGRSV